MNEFQIQKLRLYFDVDIRLRKITVETLKKWNATYPEPGRDGAFVKFLLIDVFGIRVLKKSAELQANKIDFVRNLFYIRVKDKQRRLRFDFFVKKIRKWARKQTEC